VFYYKELIILGAVNLYQCQGSIRTIRKGTGENNGTSYAFLVVDVEVPAENDVVRIGAVSFSKNTETWPVVDSLNEGDNVAIEGFFHKRKGTNPQYKNEKNQSLVTWTPQLLIEKIKKIG
jgi:hypothetical protein